MRFNAGAYGRCGGGGVEDVDPRREKVNRLCMAFD